MSLNNSAADPSSLHQCGIMLLCLWLGCVSWVLLSCPGLAKLFKSIDTDSSGTITVEELKKALMDWGHRISDVSDCVWLWVFVWGEGLAGLQVDPGNIV